LSRTVVDWVELGGLDWIGLDWIVCRERGVVGWGVVW
jgi:hypothetical protein